MDDDDTLKGREQGREVTQIPLLHDMVYDESLPLKPPPRPARVRARPARDHGPGYDPETRDLFEPPESPAEAELRAGTEEIIESLVQEYSADLIDRLRAELTDQLHSILDDLRGTPDQDA